jgi:hypothetical protein
MTLKILPYGRLGNCIIQIINCIIENIYKYKHRYINLNLLKNKGLSSYVLMKFPDLLEFDFSDQNEIIEGIFWNIESKISKEQKNEIIDMYIKKYIDYELLDNKEINYDNDLIIHIRSGDVFNKNFPLNYYTQPPYSFYKKIIEENNFKNIYILSENFNLNPVINKLLENYNNLQILSNDLDTDFKIMLNSQYFVNSNSTLSFVVNLLSKNKKMVYTSFIYESEILKYQYLNSTNYYKYLDCTNYYNYEIKTYDEKIDRLLNF